MADLGKVLQQKPANQGRASNKKTRPRARPRSASRVQPPLSQSLDNGILGNGEMELQLCVILSRVSVDDLTVRVSVHTAQ